MAMSQRKYVSNLVPGDLRILTPMLIAVAVVNSATLGYDGAVMNGLLILPSFTEYFQLTTATEGLNTAAIWMGSIFGAALCQPIPDYFGRRKAILVSAAIVSVGAALQGAAQHIAMFVVARVLIGLGATISNAAAPTLLAELLPPAKRAWMLGLFYSCYYVGSLLSALVNYGSQNIPNTWAWRLPSLLQIVPSLIAIGVLPFVPESPRWLVANNRAEEAQEVFIVMQGKSFHDEARAEVAVSSIKSIIAHEAEEYKHSPWRELFANRHNWRRLAILVTFGSMIEMFGNFIISYYLAKILDQAGVTDTTTQTQIQVIINCWGFAIAVGGSFALDKFGRRRQTFISVGGMVATLLMTGGMIKRYGDSTNNAGIYGTIAVIFLFQGFYAFGITPMTALYATEVSPFKIRTTGVALFKMLDASGGLLASFAFIFAMEDLGWRFYFINAVWDFVFLIIAYFIFVETRGMELEHIAVKFGDEVSALYGDEHMTSAASVGANRRASSKAGVMGPESAPEVR